MTNINYQSVLKTLIGLNGIPQTANTQQVSGFTEILANATNQKVATALSLQGLALVGSNAIHMRIGDDETRGQLSHVADGYNIWAKAGNAGSYMQTGSGNDWLLGGNGADVLFAGAGNDYLHGGDGADSLNGDAGDDILHGAAGADKLNGGDGNDLLIGGAGVDTLTGGAGADTFALGTHRSSRIDIIKDFSIEQGDKIDITGKFTMNDITFERHSDDNSVFINVEGRPIGRIYFTDVSAETSMTEIATKLQGKITISDPNKYTL